MLARAEGRVFAVADRPGRRTDVLRRSGASWQIARRKVVLAVNVIPSNNLSIFF